MRNSVNAITLLCKNYSAGQSALTCSSGSYCVTMAQFQCEGGSTWAYRWLQASALFTNA